MKMTINAAPFANFADPLIAAVEEVAYYAGVSIYDNVISAEWSDGDRDTIDIHIDDNIDWSNLAWVAGAEIDGAPGVTLDTCDIAGVTLYTHSGETDMVSTDADVIVADALACAPQPKRFAL